jgi:hypothetical protein
MKRDKKRTKLIAVAFRSQLPYGRGGDKIIGKLSVEGSPVYPELATPDRSSISGVRQRDLAELATSGKIGSEDNFITSKRPTIRPRCAGHQPNFCV